VSIGAAQLAHLLVAAAVTVGALIAWRMSLLGKELRALIESRLALMLRGHSVSRLERTAAIGGFAIAGLDGVLWSLDTRIRPDMGLDASLVGVVCFVVGPLLFEGPAGLLAAALGIALVRFPLILYLEADWTMTATILVLGLALLARRAGYLVAKGAS
jgi:branched-chain amino acid transport system permease protein